MGEQRDSIRDMIERQTADQSAEHRLDHVRSVPAPATPSPQRTIGGVMTIVRLVVLGFLVAYSWSMGQIPSSELNGFGKLMVGLFFIVAPALYLLPTIEGKLRHQPNIVSIAIVNLLLGWTLVGWVVAMAWACTVRKDPAYAQPLPPVAAPLPPVQPVVPSPLSISVADELRKLADLKAQGILSEDEFSEQKAKVLAR